MINSLLKRFGYKVVLLSELISADTPLAAFASGMEAELEAGAAEDITATRFWLFQRLYTLQTKLADMAYMDLYAGQKSDILYQATGVATTALIIAQKFGGLMEVQVSD